MVNMSRARRILILCCVVMVGASGGALLSRTLTRGVTAFRTSVGSHYTIRQYLEQHPIRRLQIGAGLNSLPGWLNTDIEPLPGQAYLDAAARFPVPDGSFQYVFSEHVIEHLTRDDGMHMLRECHRLLSPGGKIRIATPNLLAFVQLFSREKSPEAQRYIDGKLQWHGWPRGSDPECLILNYQLRSFGHQFLYDPATLRESLERAGFQMVKQFQPGESDDSELRGLEARYNSQVREMNDYETMIVQAIRP